MSKKPTTRQVVDAIYRKIRLEANRVAKQDWRKTLGPRGNEERDRFVQGMRDAATIVYQVWDQKGRP